MIGWISISVFSYAGLYLLFSLIIVVGEKRIKKNKLPENLPKVSVVVCARNEEKIISRCIESLTLLDYPKDKLGIFLVDDESEDSTLEIMKGYAVKNGSLKVLSTSGVPKDLTAKQRPLNLGIENSDGEFIFITDADIAVHPGWIKGHLSAYNDNTGIVGGCTGIDVSGGKLFDYLQSADLSTKHSVAMGSCGLGFPLTVMGNNISFRRAAYDSVGGLRGLNSSIVEDMALMNSVVRKTRYILNWVKDKNGVVVSLPEKNFDTFITQRLRWIHEVTDLSTIGKIMLTMESLMYLSFFASLAVLPYKSFLFITIFISWIAGYSIMLMPSPSKKAHDFITLPLMLIFQIIYAFVSVWRKYFIKKKVVWKGRVYG